MNKGRISKKCIEVMYGIINSPERQCEEKCNLCILCTMSLCHTIYIDEFTDIDYFCNNTEIRYDCDNVYIKSKITGKIISRSIQSKDFNFIIEKAFNCKL